MNDDTDPRASGTVDKGWLLKPGELGYDPERWQPDDGGAVLVIETEQYLR